MAGTAEALNDLNRAVLQLTAALESADTPEAQAAAVANTLRAVWPTALVTACRLVLGEATAACVLDADGHQTPALAAPLDEFLAKQTDPASGKHHLPAAFTRAKHELIAEALHERDRPCGVLLVALPPGESSVARAQLGLLASVVACRLAAVRLENECAAQAGLAMLATVASPVAHEFNNYLNTAVLQLAALEMKAGDGPKESLRALRQQARNMGAVTQQWQRYRKGVQPAWGAVDLNALVREAVATDDGTLRFHPAADLPPVRSIPLYVRQLLRLLLDNAVGACKENGGQATVTTSREDDAVVLEVSDTGPAPAPEQLEQLFDSFTQLRPGTNPLELNACKILIRQRLEAQMSVAAAGANGLVVRVRFPVWTQRG